MSHKKVDTFCFVIDASIARAASGLESKSPMGIRCREFLELIRGVCHRIAWNPAIKAEWDKHRSKFAADWFLKMFNLRKVRIIPDNEIEALRDAIRANSNDAAVVALMLKDARLIEAAVATNCRVASLDEAVRVMFPKIRGHEVKGVDQHFQGDQISL